MTHLCVVLPRVSTQIAYALPHVLISFFKGGEIYIWDRTSATLLHTLRPDDSEVVSQHRTPMGLLFILRIIYRSKILRATVEPFQDSCSYLVPLMAH
jgi:hypothetical protein